MKKLTRVIPFIICLAMALTMATSAASLDEPASKNDKEMYQDFVDQLLTT